MALQGIYTFNENDAANVRDYSTNGNEATSITDFAVANSDIGKAGVFNGSSTDLNFGSVYDFAGTDSFSIVTRLKSSNGTDQVIVHKTTHWTLSINSSNKIVWKVFSGAAFTTVTSSASIANDTLTTIGAIYDGVKIYIYLNGVLDNSANAIGNIPSSTNDFHIGTDTSDFFDGAIEMISIYSQGLTLAENKAIHDKPGGFKIDFPDSTVFANGDLLELSPKGAVSGAECVVTGDLGSNQMLLLPITNDIPQEGDIAKHVGNIYQTGRQCVMKYDLSSSSPVMKVYSGVTSFTLPSASIQIDCDGVINTKGQTEGIVPKTANYTMTATDSTVDCTGTFTVTLLTAVGITGQVYNVKNSGSGTITVDGDGSETIDGSTIITIAPGFAGNRPNLKIQSDGVNWIIK